MPLLKPQIVSGSAIFSSTSLPEDKREPLRESGNRRAFSRNRGKLPFLSQPFETDSESTRELHLLLFCSLGLSGWGAFFYFISKHLFLAPYIARATLLATSLGLVIAASAWATRKTVLLRNLLLLDLYWILGHNISHDGGVSSAIMAWYTLVPLLAVFMGGRRAAWIWMGASLSAVACFWYFDRIGVTFGREVPVHLRSVAEAVNYASICAAVLGFALYYEALRLDTETSMKRIYLELAQSNAQIAELTKLEAVGRLAGGVAHDFNNMLTVIEGRASQIRKSLKDEDPNAQRIEVVQTTAQRAASLTKQLLAFGRRQFMLPTAVSLKDLLGEMQPMLTSVLGESDTLVIEIPENLPRILVDAAKIEQVLINLVLNARDAMPHGGELRLVASGKKLDAQSTKELSIEPGEYVVLEVRDTGTGMDADTVKRIFEPFFTTKPMGQGTGLGLSTVYGIIRQSGGEVTVRSELGRGTSFYLYLPVAENS